MKYIYEIATRNSGYFSEGIIAAKKDGKWGVIDENGNVVINFEYDNSPYLDHNYNNLIDKYIIVEKNGKSGCIDKNGKVLVDFKYDGLLETSNNNLLAAIYNRKLGIINSAGETIIDFKYDEFSFFNHMNTNLGLRTNILGAYRRGENWDILDIDGNIIWTYKCKSK